MNKKMLVLISIIFALVLNMLFMPLKVNANTLDETPIEEIEEEKEENQEPTEGEEQKEINAEGQEEKEGEEGKTLEEPVEEPKEVPATEGEETKEVEEPKEVPVTEGEEKVEAETVTEKVEEPTMGLKAAPASSDDVEPATEPETEEPKRDATDDDIHGGQIFDIQKAKVIITKVDEEGNPLSGAVLQILDSEGKIIHEWTSDGTEHIIELPDGEYTIHEKEAPEGYDLAEDEKLIVKIEIAELAAGVTVDPTVCTHYGDGEGNMGIVLYYVKIAGKEHEVYCINQDLGTPDSVSIYDGEILNSNDIRTYTKQEVYTDAHQNQGIVDISDKALTNQQLYDKVLDIIYHRHTAINDFPDLTQTEIRYVTENALKNYTNAGLTRVQRVNKGEEPEGYNKYDSYVTSDGNFTWYLYPWYRSFVYLPDAPLGEDIFKTDIGNGDAFGNFARHWNGNGHDAKTDANTRKQLARYYELYLYLVNDDGSDNKPDHPTDMNLYIYSTSMIHKYTYQGKEYEEPYQNLLGITGYFEDIKQQEYDYEITNKYSTEKTSATVKKVWDDNNNQDGKRPESITVKLSNGTTVTLNEANNWEATVKDLPKYNKNQLITYTWEEVELPEGYKLTSVNVDGLITTMTNSYTPEVRNIKVNKVWYDEDNLYQVRAKEVKVDIIADGKVIKTITLNDANNWEETLEDLPVYANGKKIEYKVSEFEVEYYKVIIEECKEGFTIYNYYDAKGGEEPPKTSDSISLSVIMLILSSGIFTTCVFVKKNSNI